MKNKNINKIILILSIFFAFFIVINNAQAITPPDGCNADSYLTLYNSTSGIVTVDFFLGANYACSTFLDKTYVGQNIASTPLTSLADDMMQSTLQYIMYFFFAALILYVLFTGIQIVNS